MSLDFEAEYRRVVSAAAAILSIDLAEADVVDPVILPIESLDVLISRDTRDDEEMLTYSVSFGQIPPERELELYRKFLDANLFWVGTGGATIGVDPDLREAHLCLRVPLPGIDPEEVAGRAAELIETALHWKDMLEAKVALQLAADDYPAMRI